MQPIVTGENKQVTIKGNTQPNWLVQFIHVNCHHQQMPVSHSHENFASKIEDINCRSTYLWPLCKTKTAQLHFKHWGHKVIKSKDATPVLLSNGETIW